MLEVGITACCSINATAGRTVGVHRTEQVMFTRL